MTSVEELTSKLNPKTQQRIKMADNLHFEYQATPSLAINNALEGGLRYGAQHMLWGPRSAGKSLFALQMVAAAQVDGRSCAWVDAEGAYTAAWGERLGVKNDELIYIGDQKTYAGVTDTCAPLIAGGLDVLVIDSISTLISGSYLDKDGGLKDFGETNQIGQNAKEGAKMCGVFNLVNERTLILIISQISMNLGGYMAIGTHTVGKKTEHLNTTQIKLTSSLAEANQIKGNLSIGDQVYTHPIGRPVTWTLDKARGPAMGRKGSYDLYYAGDYVGVDTIGEIVSIAVDNGIIRKSGAWFYYGDDKYQGKDNLIKELRSNDELFQEIVSKT